MQNQGYLQQLKEQVKVKSLELRKNKRESEQTTKQLKDLISNNRNEISALKAVIKKKDEKINYQRLATQKSTAQEIKISDKNSIKEPKDEGENLRINNSQVNQDLQKNIDLLKNQALLLRQQIDREKQRNEQTRKENYILDQKLNRLNENRNHSKVLINKVDWLQSQLRQARTAVMNSKQVAKKILQKKDFLREKYETIIFGNNRPAEKGIPPLSIIDDLKTEVEELAIENKNLFHEMDFLKKENEEIESKIMLLEEKEIVDTREFKPNSETRVAVTAEFSNGLESFLITYSDLITLILVIFVLLYSVSHVDGGKFVEVFSSFQEKEIKLQNGNTHLDTKELEMLKHVRELVKDNVDPESLVRSDVRTILIRLNSSDLFAPGSADLKKGAEALILNSIKSEMQDGVKQIHVDGHTDNVPMNGFGQFPTNWELSSVRASHVARVIIDKTHFPPDRMVVTGYGEYRPIKPNNSDDNRALNRRVEIKILKDKRVADDNDEKEINPLKLQ